MAGISLYLTNVNVSLSQNMNQDKGPGGMKDCESVELGDLGRREKVPRRIIHFSSGETMEEYSTDEEEEEDQSTGNNDLLSSVDASKMTWGPYMMFNMWRAATTTISACDYLGERMASFLGITSAKYQYAIDEYYRMKKEKEEDDMENQLSIEAERHFEELQHHGLQNQPMTSQHEVGDPQTDVTREAEKDPQAPPTIIRIPAVVTAS